LTALRQFRSAPIDHEPVVAVARFGKPEQRLQEPMDCGRGLKVAPAYDIGHALQRVVDDDRQMIARRKIAPPENNVAPGLGRRLDARGTRALAIFDPGEAARRGLERAPHVEPEGGFAAADKPLALLGRGKRAAGSGIEGRAIRIALAARRAGDLGTGAEAGIDEALARETRERRSIVAAMLALPAMGRGKAKPEPGEVVDDRRLETGLAARAVEVLDAQKHEPAGLRREARVHERGIGVAEMERSVGRRGETEDRRDESVSGHGGEAKP